MDFNIKLYNNNELCFNYKVNDSIIVENNNEKYNISIRDLFEYLKSKNQSNVIESKKMIDEIIKNSIEINDEFMILDDENLIKVASKLLKDAKKMKINEYYAKKIIYFRPFNLVGLVANNKIECESKRKTIRELCRRCYEFLYPNTTQIQNQHECKEDISQNKTNEEDINTIEDISQNKTNKEHINTIENKTQVHSKTCIYEFKRGDLKGKICGQPSIENQSYCNTCIGRTKLRTNLINPIQHKLVLK
jgi:hypothetical protein